MGSPRKLPTDSFEFYLSLGMGRSYQAVADRYSVSKQAVTNRASKEGWQERIAELERIAREQFEADARSEMKAVRERQLKAARALQGKALEMLRDLPAEKAIKAASALNVGWKHELLLLGEPTERAASVEDVTRREVRELLVGRDEEDDWGDGDGAVGNAPEVEGQPDERGDHDDQPAPSQ